MSDIPIQSGHHCKNVSVLTELCIYVCIYLYVYICVYVYVCICICTWVCFVYNILSDLHINNVGILSQILFIFNSTINLFSPIIAFTQQLFHSF